MVIEYPSCSTSLNVLCKHPQARRTYYANLSFLPAGVTVTSITSTSSNDAALVIISATILAQNLVNTGCATAVLTAGRAILIVVSGGTINDNEALITICWGQSDGEADCRDVRLIVDGRV